MSEFRDKSLCVLVCVRGSREIHAAFPLLAVKGLCFLWTQISPEDRSLGSSSMRSLLEDP